LFIVGAKVNSVVSRGLVWYTARQINYPFSNWGENG